MLEVPCGIAGDELAILMAPRYFNVFCIREMESDVRHPLPRGRYQEGACATASTHSTARECNRGIGPGVRASQPPHPKISAPNLSWLSPVPPPCNLYPRTRNGQPATFEFELRFFADSQRSNTPQHTTPPPRPYQQPSTYFTMDVPEEPSNPFSTVTAQTNKLQRVRCDNGISLSHTDTRH
jgi:hypothetical protein